MKTIINKSINQNSRSFFSDNLNKYVSNISWLFIEKSIRIFVTLLVGAWTARYLKPSNFGLLSYVQSFVVLLSPIATVGIDYIVVRELVKSPEKRDQLLGSAFYLKILGSIFVLLIILIITSFTQNGDEINLLIFITALATIFQSSNVIDFYFQSNVLSKYTVFANLITLFVSSLTKVLLILLNAPIIYFASIALLDSIIMTICYFYFYSTTKLNLFNWKFDFKIAKNLIHDGWPLIFGAVAATIYIRIDQIMIKEFINTEAVGHYSIAEKLSEVWGMITVILTQSFMPSIINAKKSNEYIYKCKIQELYNLLLKLAFWICLSITLFADIIIIILFGPYYIEAANILRIYIWSTIFVFLSNGSWAFYLNENLQKLASYRLILGAIINVCLNFVLIKKMGLIGASISTLISYSISSFFFNALSNSTRENFKMQLIAILKIFSPNSYFELTKYINWNTNKKQ